MLRELMEDLEFVERKIARMEMEIATKVDRDKLHRLCSIPGIDLITGCTLLAELGSDMSVFNSPHHAASWAGLCPGNHESGGKRLSNRTRKGNRWLRRALLPGGMGGNEEEELLHRSLLLPQSREAWHLQGYRRHRSQAAHDRILHPARRH